MKPTQAPKPASCGHEEELAKLAAEKQELQALVASLREMVDAAERELASARSRIAELEAAAPASPFKGGVFIALSNMSIPHGPRFAQGDVVPAEYLDRLPAHAVKEIAL